MDIPGGPRKIILAGVRSFNVAIPAYPEAVKTEGE
jgi:hypothetical protein